MSKTDSIRLCNPIPELVEEGGLLVNSRSVGQTNRGKAPEISGLNENDYVFKINNNLSSYINYLWVLGSEIVMIQILIVNAFCLTRKIVVCDHPNKCPTFESYTVILYLLISTSFPLLSHSLSISDILKDNFISGSSAVFFLFTC